jgi:hypothetical protein
VSCLVTLNKTSKCLILSGLININSKLRRRNFSLMNNSKELLNLRSNFHIILYFIRILLMNPSSLLIKLMIEHCMYVNVPSFSKGHISLFSYLCLLYLILLICFYPFIIRK